MAIILSGTAPVDQNALIVGQARPVFMVRHDWIEFGDEPVWESLNAAQNTLSRAIRTVGRIETEDRSIPFIGTGFAIAPDLVMTADFVAKVLAGGAEQGLQSLLKQRFDKVYNVKPPSSRADSSEKFVVATGFRG